jgi:hypothetical protein
MVHSTAFRKSAEYLRPGDGETEAGVRRSRIAASILVLAAVIVVLFVARLVVGVNIIIVIVLVFDFLRA